MLLWICGFFWYASKVSSPVQDAETKTQAIIALTGGTERLATGVELLKQGKAEKLLISGVNQVVDWKLLSQSIDALPDELSEKITLGYVACDTRENALETKMWMQENGYTSLRLVTASYHMPRSLLEFHDVLPGYTILPHPVFPPRFKHKDWWKWPGTTALIASEYSKYLVVLLRHVLPFIPNKKTLNTETASQK